MTDIIVGLLNLFFNIITAPMNNLIAGYAITEFFGAIKTGVTYVYMVFDYINFIIPVDMVFICILTIVTMRILQIMWNWVQWIIEQVCAIL